MKQYLEQIETFLDLYLVKKAPALPVNAKEAIVKYSPYITLVVIAFSVPVLLFALGLSSLLAPFMLLAGARSALGFSLDTIFVLASVVLEALAIQGLFARKLTAWKYMFYATLIMAAGHLITMSLGNLIIGTGLTLYILFQVKSYYK